MTKKASIVSYNHLDKAKENFSGKKTVLVGGCFDILHYGHLQFLKAAAESGDYLIVALESDEFIKNRKRKEPIHSQLERAEILASLSMVDMVVLLPLFEHESSYNELVKKISPRTIAVTEGDQHIEKKKAQAKQINADVKIVTPLIKNFSTRRIISEIL